MASFRKVGLRRQSSLLFPPWERVEMGSDKAQDKTNSAKHGTDNTNISITRQVCVGNGPGTRSGHACTYIDNRLLVFGGVCASSGKLFNDLWAIHLDQRRDEKYSWTKLRTTGDAPTPRSLSQMAYDDNKVYVFGGLLEGKLIANDFYVLDLQTMQWSMLHAGKPVKAAPSSPSSTGSKRGRDESSAEPPAGIKRVRSGENTQSEADEIVAEPGDTKSTTTELGNFKVPNVARYPAARLGHNLLAVGDLLYLFGGMSAGLSHLNDLWFYDTTLDQWVDVTESGKGPMPCPRRNAAACVSGKCIYIWGGRTHSQGDLSCMYRYDVDSQEWTEYDKPQKSGQWAGPNPASGAKLVALPEVHGHACLNVQDEVSIRLVSGGLSLRAPARRPDLSDSSSDSELEDVSYDVQPVFGRKLSVTGEPTRTFLVLHGGVSLNECFDQMALFDTDTGVWHHIGTRDGNSPDRNLSGSGEQKREDTDGKAQRKKDEQRQPMGRSLHSLVCSADGNVYMFGGIDSVTDYDDLWVRRFLKQATAV